MNSVILGDTHFGVRNDQKIFHNHFDNFYTNIFFPYIKKHNIKRVIQVGDLFDRRKYINFQTLDLCRTYFFDILESEGIELITLIGNHDSFFKNTIEINSQRLLLGAYKNITIVSDPINIDGLDIIPWICESNKSKIMEFISNSDAEYCFGHFEFSGFDMHHGFSSRHGMEPENIFDKYTRVFSGHYHTQSIKGNIQYVGAPAEYTWSDYNDPRGFWLLTDDNETEFIRNTYTVFHKIIYDDDIDIPIINFAKYKDTFIKVIIVNKKDPYQFDLWVKKLQSEGLPFDIQIQEVELSSEEITLSDDDVKKSAKSTLEFISEYIKVVEMNSSVNEMMESIYIETQIND